MKEKSVITVEAKEAIRKDIAELKEVLKDDKEFAKELVDKILSLGQGVYGNDVGHTICSSKYCSTDYFDHNHSYNHTIFNKLQDIWFELCQIMDGKEFYDQEKIKALTDDEFDEFRDTLFNDTLDEIYDAFYENSVESLNVADINLIGE